MHRLILAILVLCVATFVVQRAEPQSCSVDFCDDFNTTPHSSLTALQRWCERFHHIHCNASLGTMDVPRTGDGTSSDCTAGDGTTFLSCTSATRA